MQNNEFKPFINLCQENIEMYQGLIWEAKKVMRTATSPWKEILSQLIEQHETAMAAERLEKQEYLILQNENNKNRKMSDVVA